MIKAIWDWLNSTMSIYEQQALVVIILILIAYEIGFIRGQLKEKEN